MAATLACTNTSNSDNKKIRAILDSLDTNEAVIKLTIGDSQFYPDTNVFSGNGTVDERGIKVSLKDQNFGNVIVSIEGEDWFKRKPYKIELKNGYPTGGSMGSFLVGKITSMKDNKGEGYILSEGFFEVKYISSDVFAVNVKGFLKQPFGDASLTPIEGYIIWKKPGYSIQGNHEILIPFDNEK